MLLSIFLVVFLGALAAHAVNAAAVFTVVSIRRRKRDKMERELSDLYCRAVEYARDGNQEGAEMMASKYRARCGRMMPPIPIMAVPMEPEDGPLG